MQFSLDDIQQVQLSLLVGHFLPIIRAIHLMDFLLSAVSEAEASHAVLVQPGDVDHVEPQVVPPAGGLQYIF